MTDDEVLDIVSRHPPEWHVCRCGKCKYAFAADGETAIEAEVLIAALARTIDRSVKDPKERQACMELDETIQHYNVRKCNNRVRVCITKGKFNTYVSYEKMLDDRRWEYVDGSAVGVGARDPMLVAQRMYEDALSKFGQCSRKLK